MSDKYFYIVRRESEENPVYGSFWDETIEGVSESLRYKFPDYLYIMVSTDRLWVNKWGQYAGRYH